MKNNSIIVNHVYQTHDYALFSHIHGNRSIKKIHVKRLIQSFQVAYLLSPILVNDKLQIIDGQHRFEAAKELGLPINYIVCQNYLLKEVQLLNTNMEKWSKMQYLESYCDLGHPEYLKVRNFMNQFPELSLNICLTILTSLAGVNKIVKDETIKSQTNKNGYMTKKTWEDGLLIIPNYNESVIEAQKLMQIKPFYKGFKKPYFVRAILGIMRLEQYDHDQFIKKLSLGAMPLKDCASITQYRLLIEDIYNYKSRQKVSLRYHNFK